YDKTMIAATANTMRLSMQNSRETTGFLRDDPAILGEWLVILMNVSSPIAFRFRRYIGRQQQALSQRFSILRPPLFPRPYLLRAGCG
ncbi:MAG TPA: hypothetical protein VK667_09520, partial [Ktedonobacteraceae bacterium]|nr:hypothetical protein [Ktedonobacteraceae bacterium]